MLLYFLTSSALEVGSAVVVWTLRTAYYGVRYGISYLRQENIPEETEQSITMATQTD
jgi:hypothetical protein